MNEQRFKLFQPYQVAWIKDDAPTAIVEKSRRIGFTYAEAYRSVERRVKLGTNHYFASRDKETAGEFMEVCKRFVHLFGYIAEDLGEQVIDKDKDLTAFVLRFANGAKIVALSSNPDVFRGKGGDVTLDEFAFHKQQRLVLKAARASARILGHQLRIVSTHNGEGNLFNVLIKEVRDGKRKGWSLHRVTMEDAVEQGFVERIKNLPAPDPAARKAFLEEQRGDCLDADEWNQECMCLPSTDASSLLSYDLIGGCEVVNLQLLDVERLPEGKAYYAGYDVGRKHDLSVLWVLERIGDVYWTRIVRELDRVKFTAQGELLSMLMNKRSVKRLCIDETGIGMEMTERLRHKFFSRVEGVMFTLSVKAELAMPLRRLFEDKLVRIPSSSAVREDLHKVRKIVTAANNVRLDAASDEEGHADRFWALALAYHAADDAKVQLPPPLARKPVGW